MGGCASSPQPALVRVAARGQPSGHLASGGDAYESDEAVEAVSVWEAGLRQRGTMMEEAQDVARKHGRQFLSGWAEMARCFEVSARALTRRLLS